MNPWASLIDPPKVAPAVRPARGVLGARAEVAHKLLALGPLPWGEFLEITGWKHEVAAGALGRLRSHGKAVRENGEWRLA